MQNSLVIPLTEISHNDLMMVGGKNASLGEMINQLSCLGVKVPGGFATTSKAFLSFLDYNDLTKKIHNELSNINIDDLSDLEKKGNKIRQWIKDGSFPLELKNEIERAYKQFISEQNKNNIAVAVRSSATAEDLPDASFAGQQETFLNINGLNAIFQAIKEVYASLYNNRAISYRNHHNFSHQDIAISAGIQLMVRSETSVSGVMFTLDTESGFRDVVFITSSYGLGEAIVQGSVNPDEFYVYKPSLQSEKFPIIKRNLGSKKIKMVYSASHEVGKTVTTVSTSEDDQQAFSLSDEEAQLLAKQAVIIENHYQKPMDIEWAKDGDSGELFILQARPETVKGKNHYLEKYQLKNRSKILITGRSIGQRIGTGIVRNLTDIKDIDRVNAGDILVTDMTDPNWEPIMKKTAAIVTNRGGRTCHAAIIARELAIPAIVGCGNATTVLNDGDEISVSCSEGDTGFVYEGKLDFEVIRHDIKSMPTSPCKIMMNVANPDRAFDFSALPHEGVGLARLEFIINQMISIHPKALIQFDQLTDPHVKSKIIKKMVGYDDPVEYYIRRLSEGIATIAAAFNPKKVIVRLSDFKSNEYANLIAGKIFEPIEENPMLGFRGASRYTAESFKDCFLLECQALKRVRNDIGLKNVDIMVPFVRTVEEGKEVIDLLNEFGLTSGQDGLRIIMMCELPTNALLADQYLDHFDGFSIGSNDMTQLTLGLDRDSGIIAENFDERNEAVKSLLSMAIKACRKRNKYIGICGQGPSDNPDFAEWLVDQGIETISLNPDTVVDTWLYLASKQHA